MYCVISDSVLHFLCENLCPNHIHNLSLPDLGTIAYQRIERVVAKFLWQFLRKESHYMKEQNGDEPSDPKMP